MEGKDYKMILSVVERYKIGKKLDFFKKHISFDTGLDYLTKLAYFF
jgi:hypothetical protein